MTVSINAGKKKKRIIMGIAAGMLVFLAVWFLLYFLDFFPFHWKLKQNGDPVDPIVQMADDIIMELQYYPSPEVEIYDFSMDREGELIIFGSNTGRATLIDREGRVIWERDFRSDPLQTKISPCGSKIAIGTAAGMLYLLSHEQEILWEMDLERPVLYLYISPVGRWLAAGVGSDDDENHEIIFYNQSEKQLWTITTTPLKKFRVSANAEMIVYTEQDDTGINQTTALNLAGDKLWKFYRSSLVAFSRESLAALWIDNQQQRNDNENENENDNENENENFGEMLTDPDGESEGETAAEARAGDAAYAGECDEGEAGAAEFRESELRENELLVINHKNIEQWRDTIGFYPQQAIFNPVNEGLLVYGENEKEYNTIYYDYQGNIIWADRIDREALITFSADGQNIVYSSRAEKNEGFSRVTVITEYAVKVKELEVAMEVKKIIPHDKMNAVFLAGRDGTIYKLQLK